MNDPLVTVLIPARNEEREIADTLRCVLDQSLPPESIEIIVVDGSSTDRTASIARETLAASKVGRWSVLDNPEGSTPTSLNRGLDVASAEVVCRVDARSRPGPTYLERCVALLSERPEVAVVGGTQVAVARGNGSLALGIARALNNRFAMGWSRYRRGATSGASDTVYLGAFRVADLRAIGGWSVDFPTNQDFELNRRMAAVGVVWFDDSLVVGYLPREELMALFRQYLRFGRWKVRYWRTTGDRPQPRQVVMLAAPAVVGLGVLASVRMDAVRVLPAIPAVVGLAFVVEGRGSAGPHGGLKARGLAIVAMATTTLGWLVGAWCELLGLGHERS